MLIILLSAVVVVVVVVVVLGSIPNSDKVVGMLPILRFLHPSMSIVVCPALATVPRTVTSVKYSLNVWQWKANIHRSQTSDTLLGFMTAADAGSGPLMCERL